MDGDDFRTEDIDIQLLDSAGLIVASVLTGENGEYSFTGLAAGQYTLAEQQQNFAPTTNLPLNLTLDPGQVMVAEAGMANPLNPGQSEAVNADLIIGNRPYWRNTAMPFNVNDDVDPNTGQPVVSALDVLQIINYINAVTPDSSLPAPPEAPPAYYDVDGNGLVTAGDVLQVINYINTNIQAEPEPEGEAIEAEVALSASEPSRQIPPEFLGDAWFSVGRTGQADILRSSESSGRATGTPRSANNFVRAGINTRPLFSTIGARDQRESSSEIADELTVVDSILQDIVEDIDSAWKRL